MVAGSSTVLAFVRSIALAGLVVAGLSRAAIADPLVDGLATDDPVTLATAVSAIERAPTTPELADALFAAGRACEDRLHDPARALALYDRIIRELPDARVAVAAQRRAELLRQIVGPGGEHAGRAKQLAELVAAADQRPLDDIIAAANVLATEPWPGAPDAALLVAELLRRRGRFADAHARYADIARRWPNTHAIVAVRGGAGNAIDARDWEVARRLTSELPATDPADRLVREDLFAAIASGVLRERLLFTAWIALIGSLALLLGSLAEAIVRGGIRLPSPRPPIEVLFLAPAALVLVFVGFTGNLSVAPVVTTLSIGALVMVWLSGAALDLVRGRGRSTRARSVAHALAIAVGAVALGYIAINRDNLLDMLVETVRFGPE